MKLSNWTFFLFLILFGCDKSETLSLPAFFSDNMVLQRDATVQFWGTAANNSEVSVGTPWGVHKTNVDDFGKWKIGFSTPNESPSFSIDVCDSRNCIAINSLWTK